MNFNSFEFTNTSYGTYFGTINEIFVPIGPRVSKAIVSNYENFFNKKFLCDKKYPLLNTYIIPTEVYIKVMKWIVQLYDNVDYKFGERDQFGNERNFNHLGGIFERAMAIAVGEEIPEFKSLDLISDGAEDAKKMSY
jgi:hypothetical protein